MLDVHQSWLHHLLQWSAEVLISPIAVMALFEIIWGGITDGIIIVNKLIGGHYH